MSTTTNTAKWEAVTADGNTIEVSGVDTPERAEQLARDWIGDQAAQLTIRKL